MLSRMSADLEVQSGDVSWGPKSDVLSTTSEAYERGYVLMPTIATVAARSPTLSARPKSHPRTGHTRSPAQPPLHPLPRCPRPRNLHVALSRPPQSAVGSGGSTWLPSGCPPPRSTRPSHLTTEGTAVSPGRRCHSPATSLPLARTKPCAVRLTPASCHLLLLMAAVHRPSATDTHARTRTHSRAGGPGARPPVFLPTQAPAPFRAVRMYVADDAPSTLASRAEIGRPRAGHALGEVLPVPVSSPNTVPPTTWPPPCFSVTLPRDRSAQQHRGPRL